MGLLQRVTYVLRKFYFDLKIYLYLLAVFMELISLLHFALTTNLCIFLSSYYVQSFRIQRRFPCYLFQISNAS
jgi:hypothetical protein